MTTESLKRLRRNWHTLRSAIIAAPHLVHAFLWAKNRTEIWEHGRQMVTTTELVEAVVRLLEFPDLKVDELDAISMEAIALARRVIAKTQGGA